MRSLIHSSSGLDIHSSDQKPYEMVGVEPVREHIVSPYSKRTHSLSQVSIPRLPFISAKLMVCRSVSLWTTVICNTMEDLA